MSFSERLGLSQPKSVLQTASMDAELRNGLWNVLHVVYWQLLGDRFESGPADSLLTLTWLNFFKRPMDTMSFNALGNLREEFFDWPWNRVYDYIEFAAQTERDSERTQRFTRFSNDILTRELAGYRFVETQLLPIGTEEELVAIQQARSDAGPYPNIQEHLRQAGALLADRDSPDYRNSIKESISAVEAACTALTGSRGTLGDCLKSLNRVGQPLHPALQGAFGKLYGWTNDAEGIRHALTDEPNLDVDDARFMLVACSAFVSYLLAKAGTRVEAPDAPA